MESTTITQFVRNADRFREVVSILAKHGLADWISVSAPSWLVSIVTTARDRIDSGHTADDLTTPQRIRVALTELGTTFIKLGQILSTRPDLVGEQLADELAVLRAHTPADSPEAVRKMVESELGDGIDDLFAEFDYLPLASASIGQVHRARLHSGERVAVKVQHPGIESQITNDLEIVSKLAAIAEKHSVGLQQYRPSKVAREFSQTLVRELDFVRERSNAETFCQNFQSDPAVRFAMPFPEFCSRRVLTMELLEGITLSDKGQLRDSGLDLEEIARRGAKIFLDMIFRDSFYHADPHPGNLIVMDSTTSNSGKNGTPRTGVIGVLDCGMVGRVDESLRNDLERILIAAAEQDAVAIVDVVVRLGDVPADFDEQSLLESTQDFLVDYIGQSLDEFDISGCLTGIIQVVREHHIMLPAKLSMLLKVFVMLEGTSRQLDPKFSLAELIEPYAKQAFRRRFSPKEVLRRWRASYRDWDRLIEILPKDSADILHNLKRGKFDIHLEHRRLEPIVNRLVLGILTAALFMGSASLWSNQVPPLVFGASLPGVLGCLAATAMGWRIVRQIGRQE